MLRGKLGAVQRIRIAKAARLAKKKRKAENEAALAAEGAPQPALPVPTRITPPSAEVMGLDVARAEEAAAKKVMKRAESLGEGLISPADLDNLKEDVALKTEFVKRLEQQPLPPSSVKKRAPASKSVSSDLQITLNVFDWSLILLAVAADLLNISKWYAIGGAALIAALYYYAQGAGWLDKLGL